MYFVYSMAFTATFMAMLPYFIYKAIRHGKYGDSLKERLGFLPLDLQVGVPSVWVHAVSVGEYLAAETLIHGIIRDLPALNVVVSTTTLAGQTLARDRMARRVGLSSSVDLLPPERNIHPRVQDRPCPVFYFPFDWRFAVSRALDRIQPRAVILMETEIWPNFLDECRRRGIPTIIANGRLSARSFSRYRLVRGFMKQVLGSVTQFLMQTQADLDRVIQLGGNPDRVRVCGNLKYDAADLTAAGGSSGCYRESPLNPETSDTIRGLDHVLGLAGPEHLIVAGSTVQGEEEILLAAFLQIISRAGLERTRLLVAPRRPERFDAVAKLIGDSARTLDGGWIRRSRIGTETIADHEMGLSRAPRVILLDSIGELASVYRFASVVFVGGSLVPSGGHNVIEPAAFAKPILVGPYTHNFKQIVKDFARAGALIQIGATDRARQIEALTTEIVRMLTSPQSAETIGARAREILEANRGATARTVAAIRTTIQQSVA